MAGDNKAVFTRWLVRLINGPMRSSWLASQRQMAAEFTRGYGPRPPGAPAMIVDPYPVTPLTDDEMRAIAAVAHGLRGGGALEIEVNGQVMFSAHRGRLLARPMLWQMASARDRFAWRLYDVLSHFGVRLKFCRRQGCGQAFIAKKRQAYCRPSHAVDVAARGRKYRRTRKARLARSSRYRRTVTGTTSR
jgi:hypothetical protein